MFVIYFCFLQPFDVLCCSFAQITQIKLAGSCCFFFFKCLSYPFRNEELETQVLQSSIQVGCNLLVFPPRLLQPLEGDKEQWSYEIIRQAVRGQHANSESYVHFQAQLKHYFFLT